MPYLIAFFVHIVGVVNLFGGFILFNQASVQYRRAATWEAARSFLTMLRFVPGMMIAGAVILLASGSYMAATRWGMGAPWVAMGMVAALLALALAIFVLGPGLRRLRQITEGKEGAITPQERPALVISKIWTWGAVTNGVTLSIAWNMVMKPGWPVAIALPIVLGAVGWTVSSMLSRRGRARSGSES